MDRNTYNDGRLLLIAAAVCATLLTLMIADSLQNHEFRHMAGTASGQLNMAQADTVDPAGE